MTSIPTNAPRTTHRLALAALAVAVSGILAAPAAQASGFQLKENSAKALGRAFAGSAAAPGDVSLVVNNPAGMSTLDGVYFKADVTAINFSTEFTGGGFDVTGQPLTGADSAVQGGDTIPVPALFMAFPVGQHSHIGLALTVPYGFTTEYPKDWVGRYKGVKSHFQSLDFTLSYSYALSENFSVGGGLIAQQTEADLTSMVDFGTLLGDPQSHDGLARIVGDDTGFGYQLGLLWRMTARDYLGFNYRSKISHTLEGNATFHDVPPQLAALVQAGNFQNTTGTADFTTPASATLSYWHQGQRFGFGANVGFTDWSSFEELRVHYESGQADTVEPENWEDTMYVSLGGDYQLNNVWTVRAGVSYDKTPTVDATRTPRVPDGNRTWLSFGLTYAPSNDFELNVGFAHLWVEDASFNNSGITGGPMGSTLVGVSENTGNLLGASITFRF